MATYWHFIEEKELKNKLKEIEEKFSDIAVIDAEFIVKNHGAFVKIENIEDAKKILLHNTIVILGKKQLKGYEEALEKLDFSQGVFVTAESKTADIEKKLISGVHGAKECHFVVIQSI